ncbi:MAG: hypothetical protein C4291_06560 [Candidatus Dadabacteria bacterium]
MKITRYFLFALSILLLNLEALNAATLLGKVAIYSPSSNTDTGVETYPLVSGNKMSLDHKALIKIAGGTLIADEGTVFTAFDKGELITFQVEKGGIYFRLIPHKQRISLKVLQGEIFSPKIASASSSIIAGRMVANDKKTLVEVSEGSSLEVLPSDGYSVIDISDGKSKELSSNELTKINAGQKIILAQANIGSNENRDKDKLIALPAAILEVFGAICGGVCSQGAGEASSGQ